MYTFVHKSFSVVRKLEITSVIKQPAKSTLRRRTNSVAFNLGYACYQGAGGYVLQGMGNLNKKILVCNKN
jgi:hypothetical protein